MKAKVGIIMGSSSDLPVMREAAEVLNELEIPFELLREVEQLALKLLEPVVGRNLADNRVNEVQQ